MRTATLLLIALLAVRCTPAAETSEATAAGQQQSPRVQAAGPQEIPSPSGAGAAEPHLTTTRDGALIMSWLEPSTAKQHALRFASFRDGRWTEPQTIADRGDFFVNWADFPAIIEDARGTLFAHWLQKSGAGSYHYDVWMTSSADGGRSWATPRLVHNDGTKSEHGFVSMAPLPGEGIGVVWLDGREMTESEGGHGHGEGAMNLRYAEIAPDLQIRREALLDSRVCECCTTTMTMTPRGPVVAYRDRSEEEIRDISYVRFADGKWSAPAPVHVDGWKIAGCPVNGPQIDSRGENAAVAWFTSGGGEARVNIAFSRDAGATFGEPLRVDGGNSIGRVDLVMLDDASALVTWIEGAGESAGIQMRRVFPDGRMNDPVKLAATSSARASGFPRAALAGESVFVAFTDTTAKNIRLTRLGTDQVAAR